LVIFHSSSRPTQTVMDENYWERSECTWHGDELRIVNNSNEPPKRLCSITITGSALNDDAPYGHISTFGPISDVTIMFLDPYFLKDAKVSAIRVHLRHRYEVNFMNFRISWPRIKVLEQWWKGRCDVDTQRSLFYFCGFLRLCQFLWKSIKKYDRKSVHRRTHRYTDRLTDANRFYNLSHAICYR